MKKKGEKLPDDELYHIYIIYISYIFMYNVYSNTHICTSINNLMCSINRTFFYKLP